MDFYVFLLYCLHTWISLQSISWSKMVAGAPAIRFVFQAAEGERLAEGAPSKLSKLPFKDLS